MSRRLKRTLQTFLALFVVGIGFISWEAFFIIKALRPDLFPWYHDSAMRLMILNGSSQSINIEYVKAGKFGENISKILKPISTGPKRYIDAKMYTYAYDWYYPKVSIEIGSTNMVTGRLGVLKRIVDRSAFWSCQFPITISDDGGRIFDCSMNEDKDYD